MNEREFLGIFNDIDDKFVEEEQHVYSPLLPVEAKAAVRHFSWGRIAAAAFACLIVTAGLIAVGGYAKYGSFGGFLTTSPNPTATEETTSTEITSDNSSENEDIITTDSSGDLPRDQQKVLYETKLNANGKSYDVTVLLRRERSGDFPDEVAQLYQNFIWGDIAIELSLNGEVLSTVFPYEACYGAGQSGGVPFDKELLGHQYFTVISMSTERDILAYFTPNVRITVDKRINDDLLNARFFTVNEEGQLVDIVRYATEEEKEKLGTGPDGELTTPDSTFFKVTADFHVEPDRLVFRLHRPVKNPWADNNTVFEEGDIPLFFDFENYTMKCEKENYKYLVYNLTTNPKKDYPDLTLMDGTLAFYEELLTYETANMQHYSEHFKINGCYVVPFFTSAENRTAGEKGAWIKLKEGSEIGDFTVTSAFSDYFRGDDADYIPIEYQCGVSLEGNLNCTATATKEYNLDGSYSCILLTLDKESCEKLFCLSPDVKALDEEFADNFKRNFDEERIHILLTDEMSGYNEIFNLLENEDSVKVNVTADQFSLRYSFETGYTYDNNTMLWFEDENYKVEVLE